jgi:hypothetical protein
MSDKVSFLGYLRFQEVSPDQARWNLPILAVPQASPCQFQRVDATHSGQLADDISLIDRSAFFGAV